MKAGGPAAGSGADGGDDVTGAAAAIGSPAPNKAAGGGAGGGGSGTPAAAVSGGSDGGAGHVSAATHHRGDSAAPTAKLTDEVAAACMALNCLQLAAECCARLQRQAESLASELFGQGVTSGGASSELEKVRTCVSSLGDVTAAFRRVQDAGIAALTARLTPRLRSAINVFEGASSLVQYDLTEEGYAAAAEGGLNAFTTEFLPVLASILAPFQFALTPALSAAVVSRVATYVSKQLEPRLRRKRFSQLGGIQLDTDMRSLVAFFVARSSRRVRERFTRLLQMAQLLSLETPAEAAEYYYTTPSTSVSARGGGAGSASSSSSSSSSWDLTPEDVRATLALRVDWGPGDIAKFK